MSSASSNNIDVAIVGGGPAGMAAALSLITAGFSVKIFERYPKARPAGNILNLWPPAIHALSSMGVDTKDLGAPCHSTFNNAAGKLRATVNLPQDVIDRYRGGFIGLLRPDMYARMLSTLPPEVLRFNCEAVDIQDVGGHVQLTFNDGSTVTASILIGCDGIDSRVRKHLWGESPKRNHDLHVIGGFTFDPVPDIKNHECVLSHGKRVQGTYSTIYSGSRVGNMWWVLEAWPDSKPAPEDLKSHALEIDEEFGRPLTDLIQTTETEDFQRWPIRDRIPLKQWSRGRITLSGDAAHPTSPYAAYGAGMSICDGYFIAQRLHGVDLSDTSAVVKALKEYEASRLEHTTEQVNNAYFLGRLFHHVPFPLTYVRDAILDRTSFLQWQVGDKNPREIAQQLETMGSGIAQT